MQTPPLIAIAGPTASGKTAAALALAQRWPVEIISVDSALVYRGMDIGTAKPSARERAVAAHHLIDLCDPLEPYSAAQFRRDTLRLIDDIRARGRHPLLVGGTMLYFKALIDGLDDMPPADAAVREQIARQAAEQGRSQAGRFRRFSSGPARALQSSCSAWSRSIAPGCMRASRSALKTCSPTVCSKKSGLSWAATTCTPICPRCAALATANVGRCCNKRRTQRRRTPPRPMHRPP
jgi:hypothetical protein